MFSKSFFSASGTSHFAIMLRLWQTNKDRVGDCILKRNTGSHSADADENELSFSREP